VSLNHAFVSGKGASLDATKVDGAKWDASHVFSGGALGSLLYRDTANLTDGFSWLADVAVGSYLRSGGVAAAPVWSTLTLPNAATAGDLLIASSANVIGSLADVATGSVLVSGGVSTAPTWSATPTLSEAIFSTAAAGSEFLSARLTSTGAVGHFNFAVGNAANSGDATRNDNALTIGYNTKPSGGRLNTSEPCFEWRIEDYYYPTGSGPFVEAHWQYYDALGAGYRPLAAQINRTNGGYLTDATLALKGTTVSYLGIDDVQYVKFSQASVLLRNGTSLIQDTAASAQWFKQLNAGGTRYNALIYYDSADRVVLGDFNAPIPGAIILSSSATPFLYFGGITTAFPCLKRNGAVLETKLGNDSGYTTHAALTFQTTTAIVAAGGGAAPTFTTIGGSGPATAAQNGWMKMLDSTGAACWVPVWK
jgi:hypothetical protein